MIQYANLPRSIRNRSSALVRKTNQRRRSNRHQNIFNHQISAQFQRGCRDRRRLDFDNGKCECAIAIQERRAFCSLKKTWAASPTWRLLAHQERSRNLNLFPSDVIAHHRWPGTSRFLSRMALVIGCDFIDCGMRPSFFLI